MDLAPQLANGHWRHSASNKWVIHIWKTYNHKSKKGAKKILKTLTSVLLLLFWSLVITPGLIEQKKNTKGEAPIRARYIEWRMWPAGSKWGMAASVGESFVGRDSWRRNQQPPVQFRWAPT